MYRNVRTRNAAELGAAGISPYDVEKLQAIARRLHKRNEAECNGFKTFDGRWDEKAAIRNERAIENAEKSADEIAAKYGKRAYHQSDCRGWSLYLVTPEQLKNDDYSNGLAVCIW